MPLKLANVGGKVEYLLVSPDSKVYLKFEIVLDTSTWSVLSGFDKHPGG